MEEEKKSIKTLHFALQAGVLLISLVFVYLRFSESSLSFDPDMYLTVGAAIAVISVFFSSFIFKKNMGDSGLIHDSNILKAREAYITRWAMLEGAAIINMIFFYLQANQAFLFIALFVFIFLINAKPKFKEGNFIN